MSSDSAAGIELGDYDAGQVFNGSQVLVPAIRIVRGVDWTIPTNADTQTFMETTVFAYGGATNGGGGGVPSFIGIPTAGRYLTLGQLSYQASASGPRRARITSALQGEIARQELLSAGGIDETTVQASAIVDLAAGDSLALFAFQSSGGGLLLDHALSFFSAILLST